MGNEYCFFATYIRAECYHQIKDKFSAAKVVKWETLLVFLDLKGPPSQEDFPIFI